MKILSSLKLLFSLLSVKATEWYKNTVHYWPFEEISNRTVIDYTGYNEGRLRGSFNIISGIVGAALEISGNNSWVDFGVLSSGSCINEPETCRSDFTIAFWLKISNFQNNRVILQLGQHRFSRGFTIWTRRSLKKNIGFSANSLNRKLYWMREWNSDDWNHIALKWDNRAGSLRIYFNCSLVKVVNKSEEAMPLEDDKASRQILGASHAKKKNTKLMVDEFAIWNHTVSDDLLCRVFKIRSVDGNYSEWSDFSPCSVSCGNGTMKRTRNCSQPSPINRALNCSSIGHSEEAKSCFLQECPLNGGYSQWSVFGNCSKTCGGGIKKRNRTCSNPEPELGGRNCTSLGLAIEVEECNAQPCPINGGYGKWTEFSQCTVSCGNGTRQRTRSCTSPQPKYGGKDCSHLGSNIEIAICNITFCPIHGGFSEWTKFSKCTRTCGKGLQERTRTCSNPEPSRGGHNCSSFGAYEETRLCNTQHCPINGGYTQWTRWGECSQSCGVGIKNRTRSCTNPIPMHGGKECDGKTIDITVCNIHLCPYSPWSRFSACSKSCANGTMKRTRQCTNPPSSDGGNCSLHGPAIEIRNCNVFPCPIDGNYSSWSNFSVCSKSCGNGTVERTRNCSNPEPKHGGMDCSPLGPPKETKSCNAFSCPIHGNFSSWSLFSDCSKSCGNGKKTRTRLCSNPVPQHGGKSCSALGPLKEVRSCNTFPCPVHGNYSSWSNFSRCSKSCGHGTMVRTRNCSNPTPKHGGKNCSLLGHSKEVRSCNAFPCPVHGCYSTWSNFSACSKSCGNGTMSRFRNCTNPQPRYNGKNCSSLGAPIDVQPCNVFPCPVRGGYTQWGNFTQCTLSCGNGTMYRTRNCSSPAPQHRGENCSKIGPAVEIRACNEYPCPIHGGYTQWSAFSQCSTSCGIGTHRRTRQCSNPAPQFGGRNCSQYGLDIDVESCYLIPCPIDGGYSEWSNITKCTKSCNVGKHSRTRQCNNPVPKHGGQNCSILGPGIDVQSCNTFPCPVHGGYSEWSGFESCTRTCGGGKLIRRRTCTNPSPVHGGRNCSSQGPSIESKSCNTQKCPDIVFKITINLTSEKWDPSLAAGKGRKFDFLTLKIQFGIKEIMGEKAVSNIGDFNFRKGSVIVEFSVNLFHQYYQGIAALQDAIQVEGKIEETLTVSPVNLTSPDVPIIAPVKITATNSSSTSVLLTWLPIPNEYSNGPILEYRITFWKVGSDNLEKQGAMLWKKVIGGEKLSSHVTNLEKFTKYQFRMAGVNHRGVGVDSAPIGTRTDQDKPSSSPSDVKASNKSSTTIYVEWSPIPKQFIHGILLGYHVHYTNLDPNGYEDVVTRIYQTGPNSTWILITNLLKFTSYQIKVSAFTIKGDGPLSDAIFERTQEDVPSRPPENVTGNNLTSTSIVIRWSPISRRYVHGVLQGYKVSYVTADASSNRSWSEAVVNQSATSAVIANLRKFTVYMVSVEGFTSKGSGIESKCMAVTTDEDRPNAFPGNVTGFKSSSTSLFVEWKHIPPQHWNGILLGYNISYFPKGIYEAVSHQIVHSSRTSTTLKNLKKFTWYNIGVAGYTSKGQGPLPPQPLVIRTSEDVPSKPVITLKARNTSHTSLLVEWSHIPPNSVHGILLGFRVLFWRFNESRDTYEKRELLPEEHSVYLKDLWIYTKYKIQILGFTSAGEGAVSEEIEVSTDEHIPSQSPVNVQAMNKTSPTKIQVQWKPIPDTFYVHGILRGYRVLYRAVAIGDETPDEQMQTKVVTVSRSSLFADLENLDAYTRYEIEVLAFTIKGDGVKSEPIRAETCNCYSTIYSNWWINPPYVDSSDSNKSGIITPILKESVKSCCGNCSEYGTSGIDFEHAASRRPATK
ncbi:uncharacterized protein LOC111334195 isoform X1 [Stylophora pistillata]|uniref:uncharacterized protein LOC111334195 isoform X1 n=1 Tax=Stylophora pistillata TaxID=50429 RepID=UPI000C038B79|nr:uncharacterized protein LOC111334195 isoform X1 [Stylophora pistillata]